MLIGNISINPHFLIQILFYFLKNVSDVVLTPIISFIKIESLLNYSILMKLMMGVRTTSETFFQKIKSNLN